VSDKLKQYRAEIDAIDDELTKLINRRADLARAIGQLKNGAVYRPEREAQILRRVRSNSAGPLTAESIVHLFQEIMSACRNLEKKISVAYLGPKGTYSHEATRRHFGAQATLVDCASIDEVFRKVEAGLADYGVVPVENSTEGAIGRTLDLLLHTPLKIGGEIVLPIHHCLMGKPKRAVKIESLYSHAQSFAQCHLWLQAHYPAAKQIAVASNAQAAQWARQHARSAAIASQAAAAFYKLNVYAENIEDEPHNTTRFLVIGAQEAESSGQDRTSLILSAPNRPGAIHALLSPLARHGVSMSKLESRPSRTGIWEYVFFIDIVGHQQEPAIAKALDELRHQASFLKVLGSYPMAIN
jgi:chorismate mutase/prephenate dehydratase